MSRLSHWLNKPSKLDIALSNMQDKIDSVLETNQVLNTQLQEANNKLNEFEKKEQQILDIKNSSEPWVNITSENIDSKKGIEIGLDWNSAFILYLEESGIQGRNEDEVVQKWLAMLYQQLASEFEQQVIDNSDNSSEWI